MARMTLAQLQAELSSRLAGIIASSDTAGLDAAISRAIRFIDSLASYTFLQKASSGTLTTGAFTVPTDMNMSKESKLYIAYQSSDYYKLTYVPWSDFLDHRTAYTVMATVYSYNPINNYMQTNLSSYAANYDFRYTKRMTMPRTLATVNRARTSNVATLGVTAHGLYNGDPLNVAGLGGTGYNGVFVLASVPSANSFTYPCTGADEGTTADVGGVVNQYCEIPDQWYDLILDVAQYQQMAKFGLALSEESKAYTKDRLLQFVREFNASLGAVVNINDEAIRNGG